MRRLLLLLVGLLLPSLAWAQSAQIQTARQYLQQHADRFGIDNSAIGEAAVTDAYTSKQSGVTHVYFQQVQDGIEVADARITVNVMRDGRVLLAGGSFVPGLAASNVASTPSLSAEAAIATSVEHLGLSLTEPLMVQERKGGANRAATFSGGGASTAPIPAKLIYQPHAKTVRLAWDVEVEEPNHVWTVRVDAATGEVLLEWDQVVNDYWGLPAGTAVNLAPLAPAAEWQAPMALPEGGTAALRSGGGGSYRVFDSPLESPNFGERTLVTSPADPVASPMGWHDTGSQQYTITRGNNTWAYIDASGAGGPNGTDAQPDGGEELDFDFPLDFTLPPSQYRPAAVANLFYWNNLIHDVLFQYGFDEVSGNFQETNVSGEGLGGDALRAEGQDGSDINNARYFRSSDGGISRIEMYLWSGNPQRDGDFDNGIIVHEVGHGVSIRITGGPNTDQCLGNSEQMGEGWSDWYGLMLSMQPGDTPEMGRGIGTYVLNQAPNGPGIRPARYSTDMGVNAFTYGDIGSLAIPHGVGFMWATTIWEMTWNLIDIYGFDPDLYNGTGGNNVALQLVTEALKMQPCSPGFVTGRDAILAADEALYEGANAPFIWEAFAKRGVGFSASQGSPNSTGDETEAFDLPPGFGRFLEVTATPDPVNNYEFIDYTLTFGNGTARDPLSDVVISAPVPDDALYVAGSASDGGTFEDGRVTFPAFDAATGSETIRTFRLLANASTTTMIFFSDDMEDGGDNWEATNGPGSSDWVLGDGDGTDGSAGWRAQDVPSITDQYLTLAEAVSLTDGAELRFMHRYVTEANFDGGVVEISTDEGATWEDLGENMVENGYNSTISTQYQNPIGGRMAFSGSSGGFIMTVADLSDYADEDVIIRFRLGTDTSIGGEGWFVDDVAIGTTPAAVNVEVCAPDTNTDCVESRVLVLDPLDPSPAVTVSDDEVAVAVEPDGTGTVEITISNDGDRALDWQIGSQLDVPAPWLSADPASGSIDVGESETVTLTFDATDLEIGEFEELLAVYSNDPENLVTDIAVVMTVVGVANEDDSALAGPYALGELFPNPFSRSAQFALEVAEAQAVTVSVYDVMGREVARLHDGLLAAGTRHGFEVDGRALASGVYLVRVTGERFAETRRITLLK